MSSSKSRMLSPRNLPSPRNHSPKGRSTGLSPRNLNLTPSDEIMSLQQFIDMGFNKEDAKRALNMCSLDTECATSGFGSRMQQNNNMAMGMQVSQNHKNRNRRVYPRKYSTSTPCSPKLFDTSKILRYPNDSFSSPLFAHASPGLLPSGLNINYNFTNQQYMHYNALKILQIQQSDIKTALDIQTSLEAHPKVQQQRILYQLREAVANGYISQQLLYNPLPHKVLLALHRILQLLHARQKGLIALQRYTDSPVRSEQVVQELKQLPALISNMDEYIRNRQKQLQQAEQDLCSRNTHQDK